MYIACIVTTENLCSLRGISRIRKRKNRERSTVKLAIYEISIMVDCKPDAKIRRNSTIPCVKACKFTLEEECV